jgi:hypothetical protein
MLAKIAVVTDALAGHGLRDGYAGRPGSAEAADFVAGMRPMDVTAHVAQNDKRRRSASDGGATRHLGYKVSLRAQAQRRGVRLDQAECRVPQNPPPRHRQGRLDVHPQRRRL